MTHRQADFLKMLAQTSAEPLMIEIDKAEGCYLYDSENRAYLDLVSGVSVSNTGHQNSMVINAVNKQMRRYSHVMVYGEFVQKPQVEFAGAILSLLPSFFENVYFVNSGTEAIEGSIKLSRKYTGRKKVISFENAYHGSTLGALSLMSSSELSDPFKPLIPEVLHLKWDDEKVLDAIDEDCAAVFAEVVRSEVGYEVARPGYLKALRKRCTEMGALLVFDEIQSGCGRTGTFAAFEQEDVVPDVVCFAKALGGGLPLGAFVSSREIMQSLMKDPALGHITTFGGNPVCCAAGLASLEQIPDLIANRAIFEKERMFRSLLKHDRILNVSGRGLMLAVEYENSDVCKRVITACINQGLLVDWFLFAPHKLRIAPPLGISSADIDKACEIILKASSQI